METEPACPAIHGIDWVNILKKLPLIHKYACVLEAGAVFQSRNVPTQQAGSASLQTADEDVFAILIVISHNDSFMPPRFSLILSRA